MIEEQTFNNIRFDETASDEEDYYGCTFNACDFSGSSICKTNFDKCRFVGCNFSMTRFEKSLRDTVFTDCKMIGCDFTAINRFSGGLRFERSCLDYSNFVAVKMARLLFNDCRIHEAYFDDSRIKGTVFDRCDLTRTSFARADLERADFSSSFNFAIDPTTCRLKHAVFSERGLRGLVAHLDIVIEEGM